MRPDEIVHLFEERRRAAGSERERMRQMCALYQGDIAVPLPELGKDERPAVINFARMGINQMGMRVAGIIPTLEYVPLDYGNREQARKRADDRRRVNHGWWQKNGIKLVLRQRGRWYFAYATSPVVIRPDFNKSSRTYGMPKWEPRSPLDCYPAALFGVTDLRPANAIFAQTRSVGWVRSVYPDQSVAAFADCHPDDQVDVLEYIDDQEWHLVASLSARRLSETREALTGTGGGSMPWMERTNGAGVTLEKVPNRAGVPWAVIAGNISLERRTSTYEGLFGMYQMQAKLQALGLIAKERSVFATEYLIADNANVTPRIVAQPDPQRGKIGVLQGGKIDRWTPDPQYANDNYIDRLERSQRVEAGMPASFSGEAASNVRTGKTISALVDDSVQPTIAEAHDVFEASLGEENRIAVAIDKAYYRGESKKFYVCFNGDKAHVTYTPEKLWESDEHMVRYPLPGADVHDVNIATGQAMGAGLMSRMTAAKLNPLIENPEVERDQITYERVVDTMLQTMLANSQAPGQGMELPDLARVATLVREDKLELPEAIIKVQREAQERQATPAEVPADQMPGIAPPGSGVEQPPAQFSRTPGQEELTNLLFSLRAPQMQTQTERV